MWHLFCNWNMVDIKYYVTLTCTAQWFIWIHWKVMIMINLIIIVPKKLLKCYWPYSLCSILNPHVLYTTRDYYPLILSSYFAPAQLTSSNLLFFSVSMILFSFSFVWLYVLILRFHIWVTAYGICPSLS